MRAKDEKAGLGLSLRRSLARALKITLLLVVLAAIFGLAGFYFLEPKLSENMVLKRIVVTGNRFATSSEVISALDLEPGIPILDFDLAGIERKVTEGRFVTECVVSREVGALGSVLDGTLLIEVTKESIPVARAFLFERKHWLTSDGGMLPVVPGDDELRFDAARRSPTVYFHSTRQTGSVEYVSDVLSILAVIAESAPGLIKTIKSDAFGNVTLQESGGLPIGLETIKHPEFSLSNLAEIVRIVSEDRSSYERIILSPSGESIIETSKEHARESGEGGR